MTGFESDFDHIDDAPTLDELWHAMVELSARIDDLATRVLTSPTRSNPDTTVHPNVEHWVREWWAVHLARDLSGSNVHWCEAWHEHPEALSRLTGLWQRWEELQPEWGGIAVWWRESDPQIQQLLGPDSPFRHCRTGDTARHRLSAALPVSAAADADPDPDTRASPRPPTA